MNQGLNYLNRTKRIINYGGAPNPNDQAICPVAGNVRTCLLSALDHRVSHPAEDRYSAIGVGGAFLVIDRGGRGGDDFNFGRAGAVPGAEPQ